MNLANLTLPTFSTIPHLGEPDGSTKARMRIEGIWAGIPFYTVYPNARQYGASVSRTGAKASA